MTAVLSPRARELWRKPKESFAKSPFRRMGQARSAGLEAVINVDRREVFRFPAKGASSDL